LLYRFDEFLQLFGNQGVAFVIEMQTVHRVLFKLFGNMGVYAQISVKIQHFDIKLPGGFANRIDIG